MRNFSKFFRVALLAILVCAAACSGSGSGTSTLPSTPPVSGAGVSGSPSTSAITEFPIARGDAAPAAITVALDGNPWFLSANAVNRMTPAGVITQFTSPELSQYDYFTDIIVGPDRALWFTANCNIAGEGACGEPSDIVLVRSTTSGSFTLKIRAGTRQEGPFPSALTNGNDSTIWGAVGLGGTVSTNGGGYFAVRTDGTFAVPVHEFPQPCINAPPGAQFDGSYAANDIARGPDGAIYMTATSPCTGLAVPQAVSVVMRVDQSGAITNTFPVPDAQGIAAGPDGNLWVTQTGTTNAIARLTTSGGLTEFPLPTPKANPFFITLGNDGNLWFTEHDASKIGRITPAGIIIEYPTPTPNAGPYGIASLPGECGPGHGDIWFAETSANKIGRMLF